MRACLKKGDRTLYLALLLACLGALCCDDGGGAGGKPSGGARPRVVVVFTALDRVYSEPVLRDFERETGIRVEPVYDAEAAKTTGLVNRLLARRDDPECDVLWNNEVVQTESLAQQGVLEPYRSPSASRIPERFRSPEGLWTGFAGRLRVLVYNKDQFPDAPPTASLSLFTDPEYRGRGVIALPYYGTTFTHVGVLHQAWGPARLGQWLGQAEANGTAFAAGNGPACDLVAQGERAFGLTDTDDARVAILEGKPIGVAVPDAGDGAILIPNTVALVRGAPHPDEAKRLIDYLLSAETERRLAAMAGAQIPLGSDLADVETPWAELLRDAPPRELPVREIAAARREVIELLRGAGVGQ